MNAAVSFRSGAASNLRTRASFLLAVPGKGETRHAPLMAARL